MGRDGNAVRSPPLIPGRVSRSDARRSRAPARGEAIGRRFEAVVDRVVGAAQVCEYALALFARGQEIAKKRGLILVDTKYEFGVDRNGVLTIADEIHTPDSSRYWLESSYQASFEKGMSPESFDKDFVRTWVTARCDPYKDPIPEIPAETLIEFSEKYIRLYEQVTGKKFERASLDTPLRERIRAAHQRGGSGGDPRRSAGAAQRRRLAGAGQRHPVVGRFAPQLPLARSRHCPAGFHLLRRRRSFGRRRPRHRQRRREIGAGHRIERADAKRRVVRLCAIDLSRRRRGGDAPDAPRRRRAAGPLRRVPDAVMRLLRRLPDAVPRRGRPGARRARPRPARSSGRRRCGRRSRCRGRGSRCSSARR